MTEPPRQFGRYVLCDEIAAGGMASVHLGRLTGPAGFARTVAIKRLHAQFARSPEFVAMLLDEARLAARIRHPNVVSTLDVIATDGELLVVMDYVEGESFSHLQRICSVRGTSVSTNVVSAVLVQALLGLHAAHEALDENAQALHLVHRDVSPQNLLVGADGTTRVLDFGVAKARFRLQTTDDGAIKGKLSYMSPEQLLQHPLDRRADLFAAGIVLWEALTGKRLFANADSARLISRILSEAVPPPSYFRAELTPAVDAVVGRALEKDPDGRFQTAREMALALEAAITPSSALEVGSWVESIAKETLDHRASRVARIERLETPSDSAAHLEEILAGAPRNLADLSEEPTEVAVSGLVSLRPGAVRYSSRPPGRRSRRRFAGLLALAIAGTIVLGVLGWTVARRLSSRRLPAVALGAGEPTSAAPVPAPVPQPSTVAVAASSLPAEPISKSTSRPAQRPIAPPRHRSACDPPYVVDRATGIKRYKPECF